CALSTLSHAQGASPSAPLPAELALPVDPGTAETTQGHGSVSIGYQNTYVNGMFLPVPGGKVPIGYVRAQSISFDVDYFFADHWSAQLGIPYIQARYRGPEPHCITTAPPQCQGQVVPAQPHPRSRFLDDGAYHGAWQDWNVGVAYHGNIDDYLLTPSAIAYLPSHRYTFFANAAVGQDVPKLELSIDLAHQLELSNLFYRLRAGHVFARKTLGQSIDYNKVDLELGYFVDETWTAKAFASGKKGNGYPGVYDQTTEEWYRHDQRARHNYANVGAGLDYHMDDKYTVSATVQRLVWGQFVFDFKYSFDMHLTRQF
ncbi:MAG: hypothetical protein ABI218_09765, partial [Caldimonas sp.]